MAKMLLGDSIEEMEAHRRLLQQVEDLEERAWTTMSKTMTKTEEVFTKINGGVDFRSEPAVTVLFKDGSIQVEKNTFHFLYDWYEYSEEGNNAMRVLRRWSRLKKKAALDDMYIAKMFPEFFAAYMDILDHADSTATIRLDVGGVFVDGLPVSRRPKNIDGQPGATCGDTRHEAQHSLLQHVLQFVHFTYEFKEYVVVKIGTAVSIVLESNGCSDDEIFEFNRAGIGCMDCDNHWWTHDGGYSWDRHDDCPRLKDLTEYETKSLQGSSRWEKGKLCYLEHETTRSELEDLGVNPSDGGIDEFDNAPVPAGTMICPTCAGLLQGM